MRLVVDEEDIAPVLEHPLNDGIWVLLGTAAHGAQDRGGDEPTFLNHFVPNPVVPLGLKRNGLPVLDHDVWLEFLKVFRRHHIKRAVEILVAAGFQTVPARHAAYTIANRKVRNEDQKVRGKS